MSHRVENVSQLVRGRSVRARNRETPRSAAQNVAIEIRDLVDTAEAEIERAIHESQKDIAAAITVIERRHRDRVDAIRASLRARAASLFLGRAA